MRKKLIKKFRQPQKRVKEVLKKIKSFAQVAEISGKAKFKVKDPKDHIVIETALFSNASYIVTGDHHLLDFKSFQDVKILSPRDFLREKEILEVMAKIS